MPGYKKPKYSVVQNQQLEVSVLDVLLNASEPLTISEICACDLTLTYQTTQKMARVLSELCEAGFVRKTHSKSKGKMIYVAVANLEKQGYDVEHLVC